MCQNLKQNPINVSIIVINYIFIKQSVHMKNTTCRLDHLSTFVHLKQWQISFSYSMTLFVIQISTVKRPFSSSLTNMDTKSLVSLDETDLICQSHPSLPVLKRGKLVASGWEIPYFGMEIVSFCETYCIPTPNWSGEGNLV